MKCEGAVVGFVAIGYRWPLRGAKKEDYDRTLIDLYDSRVRSASPKVNVEALTQNLN